MVQTKLNTIFIAPYKKTKITLTFFAFLLIFLLARRAYIIPSSSVGEQVIQIDKQKKKFRFFIVGDTGSGNDKQMSVANSMEKHCEAGDELDAIFLLGDNFYYSGVSSTNDEQWMTKFLKPYGLKKCISKVPLYAILGNHDYDGSPDAQINYTAMSSQWNMPQRFYSVQYNQLINIIATDSNFPDYCFSSKHCSIDFLQKMLKSSQTNWKLVLSHHPIKSSSKQGSNYSGDSAYGRFMRSLFCSQQAIWFSGHAHHLEHRKIPNCQIDAVISGAGGGELRPINQKEKGVLFAQSTHGFVELLVEESKLLMNFINTKEQIIYSKNFTKNHKF